MNAILIDPADDVATALTTLSCGEVGRYMLQGVVCEIAISEHIPQYHKFAVRDIRLSEPVRKYGEIIGTASCAIRKGAHVHVHNIASRGER